MRAHINPLNELTIPVPLNPDYAEWELHYPSFFGIPNNNNNLMVNNSKRITYFVYIYLLAQKHPLTYTKKVDPDRAHIAPSIIDIGCGYGGLMFPLSKEFND